MNSFAQFSRLVWRFIKPEIEEVITYITFTVFFGVLAFYQTVIKDASGKVEDISATFSLVQEKFAFITDGDDIAARIFTFGTWFIIGTIVYMIAWFLISFASGAFHNIEVSKGYIHPRTFNKSSYWLSIVGRVVLRITAGVSLLIYISIWVASLAPAWLASYKEIFLSGVNTDTIMNLLIAIVGIGLSLHVGAILLRVMLLRSKYFYQN